jgi:hypothetical protein
METFYFELFLGNSRSTQCDNDQKRFKTNSNIDQSIIFHTHPHDIEENSKLKYRSILFAF